jgi:hypothetical protein
MLPGYLSEKGMSNGRKGGGEREVLFVGKMRGGNWKFIYRNTSYCGINCLHEFRRDLGVALCAVSAS